jgi:hypothetical protein
MSSFAFETISAFFAKAQMTARVEDGVLFLFQADHAKSVSLLLRSDV